jgi:hypothetical protein
MATSSSNPTTIPLMLVSEKLVRSNHVVWKAQVLAALWGAQLTGFLDRTNKALAVKLKIKASKEATEDDEEVPNLTYDLWRAHEQ